MRVDEGNFAAGLEVHLARAEKLRTAIRGSFASPASLPDPVPADDGHPIPEVLQPENLKLMSAHVAVWKKMGKLGLIDAHPPMPVIRSVLVTPDPDGARPRRHRERSGVRPHRRTCEDPWLSSGVPTVLRSESGFVLPPIRERPTSDDIAAARQLICEELFGDFPFVGQPERAECGRDADARLHPQHDRWTHAASRDREARLLEPAAR